MTLILTLFPVNARLLRQSLGETQLKIEGSGISLIGLGVNHYEEAYFCLRGFELAHNWRNRWRLR